VEVEHRLARAGPDIDDYAVVLEALEGSDPCDEAQHPAGLLVRERIDRPERVDVTNRQDEEVGFGCGGNVTDRDESLGRVHVVTLGGEAAEEAVILP
jgi:hypothetical protein